jgi:hypothetical protein
MSNLVDHPIFNEQFTSAIKKIFCSQTNVHRKLAVLKVEIQKISWKTGRVSEP